MAIENRPLPLETQLEMKLDAYRDVRRDFYSAKERAEYLGQWMLQFCVELASLRYQIANQKRDEQLTAFDGGEYYEENTGQQGEVLGNS